MEHRPKTELEVPILGLMVLLGLALLLFSTSPLLAEQDSRWSARAYGLRLSPSGDEVTVVRSPAPALEERTTHSVTDDGTGFGLSVQTSPLSGAPTSGSGSSSAKPCSTT